MHFIYSKLARTMKKISSFHFLMFHRTSWIAYSLEKKASETK